ncbi:MAG: homoserine dehydrogenase [Clostridia bacterium]|jgi:homoserine dehydrogenase|nr:homoserine dehydrogenase [Clostridia bacterium]
MKTKRIILCGLGNVGKTFLRLVAEREKDVAAKYGLRLEVGCVVDLGGAALSKGALPLGAFLNYIQAGGKLENFQDYGQPGLTGVEALKKNDFDILVETTPTNLKNGEPAASFVTAAIEKGMDVVSANKGPFVLYFEHLQELAKAHHSNLYISAATGAALPSLDVGRFSTAGADITAIEGILNGTTNFILTKMSLEKCSYQDALKEAQAMGIAETDPTLDVEGYDTRNKLILLSNTLLGTKYGLADVPVTGITQITPADIERTAQEGKVLKLVANAEIKDGQVSLSVQPRALGQNHPLAGIHYSEKGVTYTTDTMGQITVFGGKSSPVGAAAALLKDIIHSVMLRR